MTANLNNFDTAGLMARLAAGRADRAAAAQARAARAAAAPVAPAAAPFDLAAHMAQAKADHAASTTGWFEAEMIPAIVAAVEAQEAADAAVEVAAIAVVAAVEAQAIASDAVAAAEIIAEAGAPAAEKAPAPTVDELRAQADADWAVYVSSRARLAEAMGVPAAKPQRTFFTQAKAAPFGDLFPLADPVAAYSAAMAADAAADHAFTLRHSPEDCIGAWLFSAPRAVGAAA